MLYDSLIDIIPSDVKEFKEITGKGIQATINNKLVKIGNASFIDKAKTSKTIETSVLISFDNEYIGKFIFNNQYRKGVFDMFKKLSKNFKLALLSGDNEGEKQNLTNNFPENTQLIFNQKPDDKLEYIKRIQRTKNTVMMFGDGLNDAGALAQSNVGVAVSENVNVFSPACDAIIAAEVLAKTPLFLKIAKKAISIIKASFVLSFLYNFIGLYFAISGQLSPVIAAILMPLSSISVVIFVTILTNYISKPLNK
jgi:Cu+-exporting ATPase